MFWVIADGALRSLPNSCWLNACFQKVKEQKWAAILYKLEEANLGETISQAKCEPDFTTLFRIFKMAIPPQTPQTLKRTINFLFSEQYIILFCEMVHQLPEIHGKTWIKWWFKMENETTYNLKNTLNFMIPFLWMEFNCLKTTELLRWGSF